ncbi:PfkB family carbohydrate kinase [Actinomadura fibrosa]|uniref:PfkB family carbohydrate kinase n=1 Tax=Actinomadura fibrosa TaxID=111802 RepID=A0ABW2XLL5_9ACTN|nr:PfkB family carbohydrate kinase [Actinomadura fibrosa]
MDAPLDALADDGPAGPRAAAGAGAARSPARWPGLDGVDERRFSLFVVGDVRIEVRASLPGTRFTELTADRLAYAPARAMVAGTAVNLARCATGYFRRVSVLAKIGDDDFTPVIRRELRRIGVRDRLRVEPGAANGVTIMLRDRGRGDAPGTRLLVAEEDAPGRRLTESEVRAAGAGIRRADVLFLDGYALLSPVSRAAVHAAARIARDAGTLVAFDLVPHDIDERLAAVDVLPLLSVADVVFSEAPTLARVLGLPPPVGGREVRGLLPALDRAVPGRPLWLLRFGATSLELVLAHQRERLLMEYPTGYGPGVERAGFGDRLASGELYWWLSAR